MGDVPVLSIYDMERNAPPMELPKRKEYEWELTRLQIEMLKMQLWAKEEGATGAHHLRGS